jgi:hypothetical protein
MYIPASCGATSSYRNRLVVNATNATNSAATTFAAGDKINFTVLIQNTLSTQISYKKFVPKLVITTGGKTLTTLNFSSGVEYLNINPNGTWKKTVSYTLPSSTNVSDLKVNFAAYWGSGVYCGPSISEIIALSPTGSASPTPTTTATTTSTPSGSHVISLHAGYNTVAIPVSWGNVTVGANYASSVTVFDYNWLGDKAWRPSNGQKVTYLTPGMGYYIYTSAATDLYLDSYSATNLPGAIALPGWTLLANSLGRDLSIANDTITVYKSGVIPICRANGDSLCAQSETIVESKTIKELINSEKAYHLIYVVSRDDTSDPDEVFDIKTIDSSNIDSVTIPTGKNYWIYTGSEKWYE